jgi:hypothetical protein
MVKAAGIAMHMHAGRERQASFGVSSICSVAVPNETTNDDRKAVQETISRNKEALIEMWTGV